jgi:hypothetical protein
VRRASDEGHDRETVADILDVSPRSTYHKYKQAYAYEFPIDEFRRSGSGGQHPQGAARRDASDDVPEESATAVDADSNAGLDTDADSDGQGGTDGDEPGRVNQGTRGDDVDGSDCDDAVDKSGSVGFGEIDPEVLRMVHEAIIEQLSGDD